MIFQQTNIHRWTHDFHVESAGAVGDDHGELLVLLGSSERWEPPARPWRKDVGESWQTKGLLTDNVLY